MNDAHIYCTEEQFEQEFKAVNDMYLRYFKIFGIDKYVMRFSKHDPKKLGQKYLDMPELWKKTEDMVRKVLMRMLSSRGYDVKTASSVSEAEALFDDPGNDFELLITDVMIPQGSGHALARNLVARQPALRVLFVSGYSGGGPIEGIQAEQVRFLTKPFGSAELTQMIHELLPDREST